MGINVQISPQYQGVLEPAGSPQHTTVNDLAESFATVSDIPAGYIGTARVGTDIYVGDGLNFKKLRNVLIPSGGDDGPAIAAMSAANRGVVLLSSGLFKVNSPIILEGIVKWRDNAPTVYGVQLIGSGEGATIVDTSGIPAATLQIHDTFKITGITNASPAVVTLDATTPLPAGTNWTTGETRAINGTRVFLQTPESTQTLTNSMESINGVHALNSDGGFYINKISTTSFSLYHDATLTQPVDLTATATMGTFGTGQVSVTEFGQTWNPAIAWKVRRYYGKYNYTPAIRFVGNVVTGVERAQTLQPFVSGITFRGISGDIHSSGEELNGICIAMEDELSATADTKTVQGLKFERVKFGGYHACALLDDATNDDFNNCEFQGNNIAVLAGYNFDIATFKQCRFGDDIFVAGVPRQQVLLRAPVYYAPLSTYYGQVNQANNVQFDSCWFMGVHDVAGDLQPTKITFNNCYAEQIRRITTQACGTLVNKDWHFSNMLFSTNFKNQETVFGAAIVHVVNSNESDVVPTYGWIEVYHNVSASEITASRVEWFGNRLVTTAPTAGTQDKGHIKYNMFNGTTSTAKKFITLYDDVSSGTDIRAGRGNYSFMGADQVSGEDRVAHVGTFSEGTNNPARYFLVVPEQYNVYNITLNHPVQIWGPSSALDVNISGGRSWNEQHNGGTDYRCFRNKPLIFNLVQDAVGSFAVSFTADYVTAGLVASGTANQKTRLEFRWDGGKWRLAYPNAWA